MNLRLSTLAVLVAALALFGCRGPSANVTGRVTCNGKPVAGGITFSPKGEGADNTGISVSAELSDDGSYEVHLKSVGKHTVVVTPRDVKLRLKPGEVDYPCDRSPTEWDVRSGDNEMNIEMKNRQP